MGSNEAGQWKRSLDKIGIDSGDLNAYDLFHIDGQIYQDALISARILKMIQAREPGDTYALFARVLEELSEAERAEIRTRVMAKY